MVVVTMTQTPNKHKRMKTQPSKAMPCGHKITACYLAETKMNFSIAFQLFKLLNGMHTIV